LSLHKLEVWSAGEEAIGWMWWVPGLDPSPKNWCGGFWTAGGFPGKPRLATRHSAVFVLKRSFFTGNPLDSLINPLSH
jgi:hypothetical protein